ncbi:ubiquitin-like protein 7 isoform X2 [Equus przewalskii]|uniref:Ubiquitin-like protein 7 isoform X2 n=1 Tax=Equus przewalskii TaxID=9798 RepID=A0ABM4PJK2_EQUPR|nr:ubiquitin-like protein 7 isoform X2 [Equus caballus]
MTPPPPRCAALGAPRARVPGPLARSGFPLRLLLLLVWTAATTQGHPRSGPRISAVWKGGFLFEGLSDDEDVFHPSARSTPSSSTPSSRPASLGYSGAAGPRPITQSELATALALASTPESSSHTPTPGTQPSPFHSVRPYHARKKPQQGLEVPR